jgi:hypothetical protein
MKEKIKTYYKNWQEDYSQYNAALFFIIGFIFDLITLGRVDDNLNLISQAFFLLMAALYILYKFSTNLIIPFKFIEKNIERFGDEAYHFCLGSLLSAFTIFYFKSSSLANSLIFMCCMILILLLNETEFIKKRGLLTKAILFQICLYSFSAMVIPTLIGHSGFWIFFLSLALSHLSSIGIARLLIKYKLDKLIVKRQFINPSYALLSFFLVFYLLRVIPPVPLSTKFIGIYHDIQKKNGQYVVKHENPWWRVWHNGDQNFIAKPGDKIIIFTSVFSPAGFKDKVYFHFKYKNKKSGWQTSDKIPMNIQGGRGLGFRGYAIKKNYSAGDWIVYVETSDGLELGRLSFNVKYSEFENNDKKRIFERLVL